MTTLQFSFEAGALIRRRLLFQLRTGAQRLGLAFNHIDDGGWLSTEYTVTIEGDSAAIEQYRLATMNYLRALQ